MVARIMNSCASQCLPTETDGIKSTRNILGEMPEENKGEGTERLGDLSGCQITMPVKERGKKEGRKAGKLCGSILIAEQTVLEFPGQSHCQRHFPLSNSGPSFVHLLCSVISWELLVRSASANLVKVQGPTAGVLSGLDSL